MNLSKDEEIDYLNYWMEEITKKWKQTGYTMNPDVLQKISDQTAEEITEKDELK